MPIKKPPSRKVRARSSCNDPRRLLEELTSSEDRKHFAARCKFGPYAKHKKNPTAYGLTPYSGMDEDRTYCDEHAGFGPSDIVRAPDLLRRGIAAGLIGDAIKKGDPGLLWSVDDNGWIYEAQITNPGYALYHAYPVLPKEAIAQRVLIRYAEFVAQQKQPHLDRSLKLARGRYT